MATECAERESRTCPTFRVPRSALCVTAGVLAGALLWLCYFPVALGWLSWIALVPLLLLVRVDARPAWIYLGAWACGLSLFFPAISWMPVADFRMYYTWILLSLHCSLFVVGAIFLLRCLDRGSRLPLSFTLPVVWTALEYLRAHLLTGFPWYFLGHAQHDFLTLIQVSDLGGAYAVTFVVAAVNGLVFESLYSFAGFRSWRSLRWQFAGVALLLLAVLGYGQWRLSEEHFTPGPRVALVQGNLDQRIRNRQDDDAQKTIIHHYRELSDWAVKSNPDLIVWPETSYPGEWRETTDGKPDTESRELLEVVARRWKTHVLLGLNASIEEGEKRTRRYNSALLVTPEGHNGGRYDKMHRVPFGEYVPLRDWIPWMNYFAPYDFDYSVSPGTQFTRFPLGKHHFGSIICYEDTDPYLPRQYAIGASDGAAVDFLVNISNDGWFDGSCEHEEHLAICRFRAVECRRPIVRAVNMGISAVIDGSGRVLEPRVVGRGDLTLWELAPAEKAPAALPPSRWREFKKTAGVLTVQVPLDQRTSLYARWGDWLPWACWFVLAGCLLQGVLRPRSNGEPSCP